MKKVISIVMIAIMIFSSFTIISNAKTNHSDKPKITYAQLKRSNSKIRVDWQKPDNKHKNKTIYYQLKLLDTHSGNSVRWGKWQSTKTKANKMTFIGKYSCKTFFNPIGIRVKYGKNGKSSTVYILKK